MKVGDNFKLLISFFTPTNYEFHNVTEDLIGVGFSIRHIKHRREDGKIQTTYNTTEFIPCSSNYLDGFSGGYSDIDFYNNITLAYCVPDGTELELYGIPTDIESKDFMISFYNINQTDEGK